MAEKSAPVAEQPGSQRPTPPGGPHGSSLETSAVAYSEPRAPRPYRWASSRALTGVTTHGITTPAAVKRAREADSATPSPSSAQPASKTQPQRGSPDQSSGDLAVLDDGASLGSGAFGRVDIEDDVSFRRGDHEPCIRELLSYQSGDDSSPSTQSDSEDYSQPCGPRAQDELAAAGDRATQGGQAACTVPDQPAGSPLAAAAYRQTRPATPAADTAAVSTGATQPGDNPATPPAVDAAAASTDATRPVDNGLATALLHVLQTLGVAPPRAEAAMTAIRTLMAVASAAASAKDLGDHEWQQASAHACRTLAAGVRTAAGQPTYADVARGTATNQTGRGVHRAHTARGNERSAEAPGPSPTDRGRTQQQRDGGDQSRRVRIAPAAAARAPFSVNSVREALGPPTGHGKPYAVHSRTGTLLYVYVTMASQAQADAMVSGQWANNQRRPEWVVTPARPPAAGAVRQRDTALQRVELQATPSHGNRRRLTYSDVRYAVRQQGLPSTRVTLRPLDAGRTAVRLVVPAVGGPAAVAAFARAVTVRPPRGGGWTFALRQMTA